MDHTRRAGRSEPFCRRRPPQPLTPTPLRMRALSSSRRAGARARDSRATYIAGVDVGDGVLLGLGLARGGDERDGAEPEGNYRGGGNELLRRRRARVDSRRSASARHRRRVPARLRLSRGCTGDRGARRAGAEGSTPARGRTACRGPFPRDAAAASGAIQPRRRAQPPACVRRPAPARVLTALLVRCSLSTAETRCMTIGRCGRLFRDGPFVMVVAHNHQSFNFWFVGSSHEQNKQGGEGQTATSTGRVRDPGQKAHLHARHAGCAKGAATCDGAPAGGRRRAPAPAPVHVARRRARPPGDAGSGRGRRR